MKKTDFDTARAFLALNVEVAAVRRVAAFSGQLQGSPLAPMARWVAPPKLHVTLRFLGDIDVGLVGPLRDVLSPLAARTPAPRLTFTELGAFPSKDEARVVFLELGEGREETVQLATFVADALEELGFARETRPFHPHLTIARLPEPADVTPWLAEAPPAEVATHATELVLYRSDFARPGAEYDPLGRFVLSAPLKARATAG